MRKTISSLSSDDFANTLQSTKNLKYHKTNKGKIYCFIMLDTTVASNQPKNQLKDKQ